MATDTNTSSDGQAWHEVSRVDQAEISPGSATTVTEGYLPSGRPSRTTQILPQLQTGSSHGLTETQPGLATT